MIQYGMPSTGNIPQSAITVGQRFDKGVVVCLGLHIGPRRRLAAELLCDCGTTYTAQLVHLRAGLVHSCGCLRRETCRATGLTQRSHGLSGHPLYSIWFKMLDRCENPRNPRYHDYGGRGIRVCERWHDVRLFVADLEKLLGSRPMTLTASGKRLEYSLDRWPDPDGDYKPGNVQWATWSQQRVHRRRAL